MALNPFIPTSGSTHLTFRNNYNTNITEIDARISGLEAFSGDYSLTGHQHVVADITDIAANYQPLDAVLTNTTASFTTTDETKLDYITVTQAVDLDAIEAANGDMLKSVYDTGNVSGDAFNMDNMVEGTTSKILTTGERDQLANLGTMANASTGDYSLTGHPHVVADITDLNTGSFSITGHTHSLADLTQDGATDGQAPVWSDGSGAWIPSTVAAQGGGGISLSGITTGTAQEEMFVGGVDQSRIDVTTGTSLTFSALVVGRRTDGGGTGSAGYEIKGLIKNDGGTTSFVGTPTKYVLGEDADWDATVSGDNTNDALAFLVSGEAGADIEWRATVNKVEFTE